MLVSSIESIANRLYAAPPADLLFHYTSLSALQSILRDRCLWATDLRYFSDAAVKHLMNALHAGIQKRIQEGGATEALQQFREWLSERLPQGDMVFAASFSAQGDLLSQWRAYCPPGKGVSLCFKPDIPYRTW